MYQHYLENQYVLVNHTWIEIQWGEVNLNKARQYLRIAKEMSVYQSW